MRADGADGRKSVEILKVGLSDLPARPARGRRPIDVHPSAIIRQEGDPRTIWRPARHGLVVGAARDETRFSTPQRHDGNIHRPVQGVVVGNLGTVGRPATRQREPVRVCQRANRQCRRVRPSRRRADEASRQPCNGHEREARRGRPCRSPSERSIVLRPPGTPLRCWPRLSRPRRPAA